MSDHDVLMSSWHNLAAAGCFEETSSVTNFFLVVCRDKMSDDGVLVTQSGCCGILNYKEVFTTIHSTLRASFKHTHPYAVDIPSFGCPWGFNVCYNSCAHPDVPNWLPEDVDARIASSIKGMLQNALIIMPSLLSIALSRKFLVTFVQIAHSRLDCTMPSIYDACSLGCLPPCEHFQKHRPRMSARAWCVLCRCISSCFRCVHSQGQEDGPVHDSFCVCQGKVRRMHMRL